MTRRHLIALALVSVLAAGCGAGGDGYGCTGDVCKATFDGAGTQDLSRELGPSARAITVREFDDAADTATIAVGGEERPLRRGASATIGGLRVRLLDVDGSSVSLRVRAA